MGYDAVQNLKGVQVRKQPIPDNTVARIKIGECEYGESSKKKTPFIKIPVSVVQGPHQDKDFEHFLWVGLTISDESRKKQEKRNEELVAKGKQAQPIKSNFDRSLEQLKEMVLSYVDEKKDAAKADGFFKGCTSPQEIAQRLNTLSNHPTTVVVGREEQEGQANADGSPARKFVKNTIRSWVPLSEQVA